jgi:L-iditol 2-dehydrogenase
LQLAVLKAPHEFEVVDGEIPEIGPNDVLVRVANCGVCASELDMWEGRGGNPWPWFPGHEVSGHAAKVGRDVSGVSAGEPVAVWVTERGYAEYVAVPAEHCFPAGDVPLHLALGEPLACAVNAVELAAPALGDDVVIIGAGFMGHLVHKLVGLKGARSVIVADTRHDALERARRIGADLVVDVARDSLVEAVAEVTGGRGADVTFEVTGVQGPLEVLGEVTRMSGKVVIVGYHQGGTRTLQLGHWNWMAFDIVNAHFRDTGTIMRGMSVAMRLLSSGRVSLEGLVTHSYALEDIQTAFSTATEKPLGFVKATVSVDDGAATSAAAQGPRGR